MEKSFKYEVGESVIVTNIDGYTGSDAELVGKKGIIAQLREFGKYDYKVDFDDKTTSTFFTESELMSVNGKNKIVRMKGTGDIGTIVQSDFINRQSELEFDDGSMGVYNWDSFEIIVLEGEGEIEVDKKTGYFQDLGWNVGQLVDEKQKAYGNSVDKAYKLMQIYLENYDNGDNTYTIPKSLLQHILLQVRIIDKQNRIFNNPDGDLMQENPYKDTVGYGLLGMRMVEEN